MENERRTIAKMWKLPSGHACYIHKQNAEWVVTLVQAERTVEETIVPSPSEAIRYAAELRRLLTGSATQPD